MRIIHVLRKPLSEGTVAANTLKHGTGGLNIDASRIAHGSDVNLDSVQRQQSEGGGSVGNHFGAGSLVGTVIPTYKPGGRWPANVILQHLDGCRCDGVKKVKPSNGSGTCYEPAPKAREHSIYGDSRTLGRTLGFVDGGGTETVTNWICEPGCPVARLDEQSGVLAPQGSQKHKDTKEGSFLETGFGGSPTSTFYGDTGGASRFYKQVGGGKVSE